MSICNKAQMLLKIKQARNSYFDPTGRNMEKIYDFFFKQIISYNTPGTVGGPGGHDQTLAVKSKKITHGRFPEVGQKQKTERKKKERERKILIPLGKQYSRDCGWPRRP